MNDPQRQPRLLAIAGSDSSGGAGIQADLKTFSALGCYGASAITALTAQNTQGVQDVFSPGPEFVKKQLQSVLDDIPVDAIKTGMLYDAATIHAVVGTLQSKYNNTDLRPPLICDPVSVSTSGHSLLQPEALETLITELLPISTLITPNKSETEAILSHESGSQAFRPINSIEAMVKAATDLAGLGPKAALVKGGHYSPILEDVSKYSSESPEVLVVTDGLFGENMEILQLHGSAIHQLTSQVSTTPIVLDVLYDSQTDEVTLFVRPRIDSKNTHGTGCTLSSAIACFLAKGLKLADAVRQAGIYTYLGIQSADTKIGQGSGPLNHLHSIRADLIPRRTSTDPYPFTRLLIDGSRDIWKKYVQHEFVVKLGEGILPKANFVKFIIQDYHYLKYYARAYALLAAKSHSFDAIKSATRTILNVLHEVEQTHQLYCEEFGISEEDMVNTPEGSATTAYGAYIMDVGLQGDTSKLLMALLACLLGYGEVGLWLKKHFEGRQEPLSEHPYQRWIEDYSGEVYQGAVKDGLEVIETMAENDPPSERRLREWEEVWLRCTLLEKGFWDAAME